MTQNQTQMFFSKDMQSNVFSTLVRRFRLTSRHGRVDYTSWQWMWVNLNQSRFRYTQCLTHLQKIFYWFRWAIKACPEPKQSRFAHWHGKCRFVWRDPRSYRTPNCKPKVHKCTILYYLVMMANIFNTELWSFLCWSIEQSQLKLVRSLVFFFLFWLQDQQHKWQIYYTHTDNSFKSLPKKIFICIRGSRLYSRYTT